MDDFYVILPSNTPVIGNTASHFTVRLPQTLELDTSWTVSLSSIIYPFSFPTVGIDDDEYIEIKTPNPNYTTGGTENKFLFIKIQIPSMHYHTVDQMQKSINGIIKEEFEKEMSKRSRHKRAAREKDLPKEQTVEKQLPREKDKELPREIDKGKEIRRNQTAEKELPRETTKDKELVKETVKPLSDADKLRIETAKRAAARAWRQSVIYANESKDISTLATLDKELAIKSKAKAPNAPNVNVYFETLIEKVDKIQKYSQKVSEEAKKAEKANTETIIFHGKDDVKSAKLSADKAKKAEKDAKAIKIQISELYNKTEPESDLGTKELLNRVDRYVNDFLKTHLPTDEGKKDKELPKEPEKSIEKELPKETTLEDVKEISNKQPKPVEKKLTRDKQPDKPLEKELKKEKIIEEDKFTFPDTDEQPSEEGIEIEPDAKKNKYSDEDKLQPIEEVFPETDDTVDNNDIIVDEVKTSPQPKETNLIDTADDEQTTTHEDPNALNTEDYEIIDAPLHPLPDPLALVNGKKAVEKKEEEDEGYWIIDGEKWVPKTLPDGTLTRQKVPYDPRKEKKTQKHTVQKDEEEWIIDGEKWILKEQPEGWPLLEKVNTSESEASALIEFRFDEHKQKFQIILGSRINFVTISKQLAYVLGFEATRLRYLDTAKFTPDLSGGVKQLYVYAPKLVENTIIGNRLAPLLRVVNVTGSAGMDVQEVIYTNEFFHPLQNKRISEITIEIQTPFGRYVKFNWGTCVLTLHFKRKFF